MNEYFSGLASDVPSADPNDWSKMLMSAAATNNAWSAEQAQKQIDFQQRMSNTAHQREIADLKAAGLNPVLSARLGGASTPSGASASADNSIVSAIVQLMDKMLDVQGTSAAAAAGAVGSSSGISGSSGSGESVLPFNYNGKTPVKDNSGVPMTASDVQGMFGVVGKYIPNTWADSIASAYNGINGLPNGKNKSEKTYQTFQKVGQDVYSEENLDKGKQYHESRYAAAEAVLEGLAKMKDVNPLYQSSVTGRSKASWSEKSAKQALKNAVLK